MNEMCGDNRFEIIEQAKAKLIEATNIEDSQEEMAVIDSVLFRMWQVGWLPGCEVLNTRHERTCHVRQPYFDSDDELEELMENIACTPEDTVVCICDDCKHNWRYDRGIRPNYCPNCGIKVEKE